MNEFALGDIVETTKGAKFWGEIVALDNDSEMPGCTVRAVAPEFLGTKHVYPLKQLQIRAGDTRSEEIRAGLCPRCAGSGRGNAPNLQCPKCMGQGAVVIRGRALAAPVDHPEVVGVKIKPLEWVERPIVGGETRIMSFDGYYWLSRVSDGFMVIGQDDTGHVQRLGGKLRIVHPTIEAAKTAAQADYETRIRSALRPSDSPALEAGVAEAATNLVNFAWSAVVTDCTESAEYLNELVEKLRAALATPQRTGQ